MPNNQIQSLTISGTTYDIVDNTSGYITADSPALTGTPTAPTPLSGASDTQIATVKYVQDSMAGAGAGTVTSIGVANATEGGLSVSGSPITSSGTISVGHSNVLASAQTTSGIYPIKIDKNGHISEYGSAVSIPTNTSDLTNDSGFITGMTILSYGTSTWNDFLTAYNANKVVYCRASSNANPASGSQTRLAFMAYVNNATNPTNVEFQYYRSVNTHTESQQGDQVYVYTLTSAGSWSVIAREASVKVVAGTGLSGTYSNGTMTLTGPTISLNGSSTTSASFYAPTDAGTSGYVLTSSGSGAPTWAEVSTSDTKVTQTVISDSSSNKKGLLLSNGDGSSTLTSTSYTSATLQYQPSTRTLSLREYGNPLTHGANLFLSYDTITFAGENFSTNLKQALNPNSHRTIYLPDADGTLALTSDIPTITDTYSGTSSNGMSGKAVKSAIDALDGTISGSAGSGKTLTAFSQTDGKVSATFGAISITKSQISDFPAIPSNTSDLNNDSHFVSQIDLAENLVSTLCYLNVSGSTASLIDANASVVGIFELSLAFRSVKGVQVAQVLNISGDLAETRMYEIVDADTINRTVRLVAVEGSTVYIADLTDAGSGLTGTISTTTMLTSETDPTVPSWAKAASKPTYTASEVGALASNTTYVSKITTTAGAHTAISNQSGAISFNVPTKTSHLTNDSGYITSDSDEKVKSASVTAATTYYLIGSTSAATETATTSKHGSVSISVGANSNTAGGSRLTLGNSTAAGTAGAKYGYLRLYGNTAYYVDLQTEASYPTGNRTIYLPSYGSTMYLTCTDTTDAVGGSSVPVYVTNTGRIQAVDSLEIGLVKKPFMRATGSGTKVNLSASTITQVPLTTIEFQGEYSGISLDTTKHTILLEPGYYRISGSIYFASGVTYSSMQGIYIRMDSTSIAFANATEVAASYIYGSISINTSAIVKVVDDSYLWLGARSSTTASVDSNNTATYLEVEKIASVY